MGMNKSGIYKIINEITQEFYIGSSKNLYTRKQNHFNALFKNKHINPHLQASYNKHGKENFKFEILSICPKEYLIKLEQWFIDNMKPKYNICKIAGNKLGVKHSNETKLKISKSNKGKIVTLEARKKISKSLKGRKNGPHSQETKNKIRLRHKGRCFNSKKELMLRTLKSLEKTKKKVDLVDDYGKIMQTFNSLKEAEIALGISYKRISMCVTGVRKQTHNMKFKYHKE